jgi:hypothetical protein
VADIRPPPLGQPVTPSGKTQVVAPGPCYHCDKKAKINTFCETWRVWTCAACRDSEHRRHHQTCARVLVKRNDREPGVIPDKRYPFFSIVLTRYDGRRVALQCRLGEKLELEDHWLGTYIFGAGGMILVAETRNAINRCILEGLQATA